MRPVGLQSLPLGYTRLEFLESTGTQYIDTDFIPMIGDDIDLDFFLDLNNGVIGDILFSAGDGENQTVAVVLADNNNGNVFYFRYFCQQAGQITLGKNSQKINCKIDKNGNAFINGIQYDQREPLGEVNTSLLLFKRVSKSDYCWGRIYVFSISRDGQYKLNLLPCINSLGIPCMFDLVSKTPFYNAGTGAFIAGLTNKQALSLSNLPVTEDGTLTVSLPWDAQWDEVVQKALSRAAARGWIITVQYRDPEVATANIPISFLEGTGTQYINTGIKNTPTSKWEVDYQSKKTPGTTFESIFGGQTNTNADRLSAIILTNNSAARFTAAKNYGGGAALLDLDIAFSDDFPATARHIYGIDVEECVAYVDDRTIKGKTGASLYTNYPVFVMARNTAGSVNNIATGKLYGVRIIEEGGLIQSQVPVLSPSGTPCMYDSVSRQNFYNQGTGAFIAGFDTAEQARKLAYLPDVTAETDDTKKSLTVSIPLEAALDPGVRSALDVAAARGWTIIVQHRESEVATTNLKADFLESTGGQYIDTSYYPCWDTEIKMTGRGRSQTAIFGCVSEKTQDNGWKNCYMLVMYDSGAPWAVFGNSIPGNGHYGSGIVNLSSKFEYLGDKNKITINGVASDMNYPSEPDTYRSPNTLFIAARNHNGVTELLGSARIFDFQLSENGAPKINFIPVLDPSGTPCMYDTVSGQNFYNQGTGSFIVGFDTTEKAAISLSKLPVATGVTLTVSLPSAAQNASTLVPAAIDIAKSRGWTIITQYRTN